jgi:hypothetical protein
VLRRTLLRHTSGLTGRLLNKEKEKTIEPRCRKWLFRHSRTRSVHWAGCRRLLQQYPLAGARTVRSDTQRTRDLRSRML